MTLKWLREASRCCQADFSGALGSRKSIKTLFFRGFLKFLISQPLPVRMAPRWRRRPQDSHKRRQNSPQIGSRWLQQAARCCQVVARGLRAGPKRPQDNPKRTQHGLKMASRWLQNGPRTALNGPKMAQDGPKRPQDGPKMDPKTIQNLTENLYLYLWSAP